MKEPGWVSVRHVRHIVARGEAAGLPMSRYLDEAGVTSANLADPDGAVPIAAIEAMLAVFVRQHSDPLMGLHLANDIQPAALGALGYISQACATYGDLIETLERYAGFLSNIGDTSVVLEPGQVEIRWRCLSGGELFRRQATEYVVGLLVVLSRLLLPEKTRFPQAVQFALPRPEHARLIPKYDAFFQCPVHFDRPWSGLVVSPEVLKTRLRYGDALMKDALDQHARNVLRQREKIPTLPDDVRRLVATMIIEGTPTLEAIAAQLGISARSLHRKLQELGTGYREILDEVRLEMAQSRLREGNDTVNRIAEYLGFRSHQAFVRWYRKSTGTTPGEVRRRSTEAPRTFIDALNVAHWCGEPPTLRIPMAVMAALLARVHPALLYFDASARYRLGHEAGAYERLMRHSQQCIEVPSGRTADGVMLRHARSSGAGIVTRDQYRDHRRRYRALIDEPGRLMPGVIEDDRVRVPSLGIDVALPRSVEEAWERLEPLLS